MTVQVFGRALSSCSSSHPNGLCTSAQRRRFFQPRRHRQNHPGFESDPGSDPGSVPGSDSDSDSD